ncbi:hypothetical protein CDD82_4683 [Ophiocordyceps australis]|uniref:Oxidoreductase n=1 Tax=Ophiocordyceps australis TaxID=1399860 RepID=A0A2C5ZWF2_9HYPO|nr:hypothetical protein CDD82_4683 [Ophiocordyceps australis]
MTTSAVLIIGATRGLGARLVSQYAQRKDTVVYATTRSNIVPSSVEEHVRWLTGVDLMDAGVGERIVKQLKMCEAEALSAVIISAGHFTTEDLSKSKGPSWDEEQRMYTTSAVAPIFITHQVVQAGLVKRQGGRIVLVSSEAGSIGLRHANEGGGNYGHHGSKAALNMAGRLLSLDLEGEGIVVSMVHPGFMRTDMTAGVGFDKYWDQGHGESATVTADQAASSLIEWTDGLDMSKTGQFWAPRGPRDIGTAEAVMGANLPTPLQLPW